MNSCFDLPPLRATTLPVTMEFPYRSNKSRRPVHHPHFSYTPTAQPLQSNAGRSNHQLHPHHHQLIDQEDAGLSSRNACDDETQHRNQAQQATRGARGGGGGGGGGGRCRRSEGASPSFDGGHHSNQDEDNPIQQQAVLESLASYLEGELMSRLQAYSELLVEVESLTRERSFYHTKLLQVEKVCKHVLPLKASISKLDPILTILSSTKDMPCT